MVASVFKELWGREFGGGFIEYRGEPTKAAGEDGPVGCAKVVRDVDAACGRGAGVLERGTGSGGGGRRGEAFTSGVRGIAERADHAPEPDPVVVDFAGGGGQ